MPNERLYNEYMPFDRPKLPRNKWGLIDTNNVIGSGSFVNASSTSGGGAGGYQYTEMSELDDFVGATRTEDGIRGIVPAPVAGQNLHFLQGSGGWVDIPAYRWLKEWPESEGLEKRGLSIEGDFNVTDTLNTFNLNVTGAAHFWTLIIDEVKANGGQLLVSPSMFHVDFVGRIVQYSIFDAESPMFQIITNRPDIYNILKANDVQYVRCRRLYQRCDDGETRIENECVIGDMMRCRSFNIKAGEYRNVSNTDYWAFVANVGEEQFTDEDGETYDAFFIDLAFTLRKSDGHNYPLGTTLYLDGRAPSYPPYYSEITDALELKRVSRETWDGSRDVEQEYFENEEWTDIQEHVIKIRGLDDQINEITGHNSSNNLYDNDRYVTKAKESMDAALYGTDRPAGTFSLSTMSATDLSKMITTGLTTDEITNEPEGNELYEATAVTRATVGATRTGNGLTVSRAARNIITLDEDTQTTRSFEVAERVTEWDDQQGKEVVIYDKGDIIEPGTIIDKPVPVIETPPSDVVFETDKNGNSNLIDSNQQQQITGFTDETEMGTSRDVQGITVEDIIDRTEWKFGYTGYYPDFRIKKGDSLACLGHLYDSTRQNAIVLSSTNPIDEELLAPAMAQYSHIDTFGKSISYFRQTAIAANGNEFLGTFLVKYGNTYLDVNEKIDLFINDINTGLESCGIHLNGDTSSIKMVGTIDLKQHSQDSYDSLNLYDNLDVRRVEIKPFEIPQRNSSESQIDSNKYEFNPINDKKNITSPYLTYKEDTQLLDWFGLITNDSNYTVENYLLNYKTSINLGQLYHGYDVDLRDLNLLLKMQCYADGKTYMSDHGLGKQAITTLTYTIKKDGTPVSGYNQKDIIYYNYGGLNTDTLSINASTVLNNWTVPAAGYYSVEINLVFKMYAYVHINKYESNNPYVTCNTKLTGDLSADISRVNPNVAHPDKAYKMTIGTNGFTFLNDNSRYFYAANDGFELRWDDNTISFDSTRGLYVKHAIQDVISATTLGPYYDTVLCRSNNSGYTVVLPNTQAFGTGRVLTIFGFAGILFGNLKVQPASGNTIEIGVLGTQLSIDDTHYIEWGQEGCPMVCMQMMAVGNTWRVISFN